MCFFARHIPSVSCAVTPIGRPKSNFSFIDRAFPSFPWIGPLRRIFSEVRNHNGRTVVVEELNAADAVELVQENEDLEKRFQRPTISSVWRLGFFSEAFLNEEDLTAVAADSFIGYAIIKQDRVPGEYDKTRVYESVIGRSLASRDFIRGAQDWQCCVGSRTFWISGYLYAQQNGATNVCAHVACRTAAARFHLRGDMTYREMNDLLGIDHVDTRADDPGLTSVQMRRILEAAGARCVVEAYPAQSPHAIEPRFQSLIYGSVESGYPAIVCFATEGGNNHAVPIFGHTFDGDMWVFCAERFYLRISERMSYIPSDSWLGDYVCHDDNWGSNYRIPQHFLHTIRQCDDWPEGPRRCSKQSDCVAYVLATLPKEILVDSSQAQAIGLDYLRSILRHLPDPSEPWKKRLAQYTGHHGLVLRPVLVQASQYIEHLGKLVDWDFAPIRQTALEALRGWPDLPRGKAWLVELSVPELFSANRRKVAEILIRADREPGSQCDFRNYVLARVPGYFVIHTGEADEPNYRFIASGAQGHVPLFGCESDDLYCR